MAELSEKELNLLAYTLLGEAAGEGREGMEAVMWTIRNRAEDPRFPDNPANVATQANSKGVYQYSTWNTKGDGGNKPKARFSINSPEFKEALQVVQRVMAGEVEDPTGGATHYYSGNQKPAWFEAEGPAGEIKIGNHRFAARNTAADAARTAVEAAEIQGRGKGTPRPVQPVAYLPERRPDTPSEDNSSETGLTSRTVQTVDINPTTGMPYPRLTPQPANGVPQKREAVRLSQLRSNTANQQDLVGAAARVSSTNAASSEKTSRSVDKVGAAARTVTGNAASAAKTDRAAPPAKAAVVAQGKTTAQIAQEAENARLSGYRAIQEAGPSSKGAKATPQSTKSSGVTKTAGTVLSDGTKLALAGETQLPRNVTPQVTVPKPAPVTKFIKPQQPTPEQIVRGTGFRGPLVQTPRANSFVVPPPDNSKRLPAGQPLALKDFSTTPQGPSRGRGGKRGGAAKTPSTIQPPEPTIEQVVAVRDVARPRGPVGRRRPVGPVVLANGQIAAQPQVRPVAAAIAQGASALTGAAGTPGLTQSTESQESKFQWTDNTYLPDRIANDPRWW